MTIEENDFRLTPVSEDSIMFDLDLLYIVKPRGGEARKEFRNAAYGVTLDGALKRIIHYRINCKHKEEAISIAQFRKEYKEENEKLCKILMS